MRRLRRPNPVSAVLTVAGIALIVVAVIYLFVRAPDLPSFFPGYPSYHVRHARIEWKRDVGTLVLAAIAFTAAWYTSRTRRRWLDRA